MTDEEFWQLLILFEQKILTEKDIQILDDWILHHPENSTWITPQQLIDQMLTWPNK
jgi:hypothetical protein